MIGVDQAFREEKFNFVANVILSELLKNLDIDDGKLTLFFQSLKKISFSPEIKHGSKIGFYFSCLKAWLFRDHEKMLKSTLLFLRFYPQSDRAWRMLAHCGRVLDREIFVGEAHKMIGKDRLKRGELAELCQYFLNRNQFSEANHLAKFLVKSYPNDAEAKRLLWSSSIGLEKHAGAKHD